MVDPGIIDALAQEIAGIESHGSYDAVGPVTKGDRPYGKYQIMGANIPSWTRDALGEEMAPDAFLANPDAQERTAKHRLTKYYEETGNPRDVAAMWHSGVPYGQAVGQKRKDVLGTTTQDYADRAAGGMEPETPNVLVALPDGRQINLGPNPPPELRAKVKAKIITQFPQLTPGGQMQPGETRELTSAAIATTSTPTSDTPQLQGSTLRDQTVDEAAVPVNEAMGLAPDSDVGQYTTAVLKPITDSVQDVFSAFSPLNGKPNLTGSPADFATWKDALDRSLKIMSPLAIPAMMASNIVQKAAVDAGMDPTAASILGFATSLYAGAKTPVPGMSAPGEARSFAALRPNAKPPVGIPEMPFAGTKATRLVANEAEVLAGQADDAATLAQQTSSAARTSADATIDAASKRVDLAVDNADLLAQQAVPSAETATRAAEALTPTGATSTTGSRSATSALASKFDETKEPVQGIYDAIVDKATAEHRSLDPSLYKSIAEQIAALKEELGATLTGASKSTIETIEAKLATGKRLDYADLHAYKNQLDTMFPGRIPHGSTPKTRKLYDFKWDVRDMMRSMVGDEDKQWLEAADTMWRDVIIGKNNKYALGNLAKLAKKDPATFAERMFGNGTSDKHGEAAKAILGELGDSPAATELKEAVLSRAISAATDATSGNLDPRKLLNVVGKYSPDFYKTVIGDAQDTFFKVLRAEQGAATTAAEAAKIVGKEASEITKGANVAAKAAAKDADTAIGGAKTARNTADKAAKEAAKPNKLARFTAHGLEIGALEMAGRVFGHIPGLGAVGALRPIIIPSDHLAKWLANNKNANILARALRTSAESPAAIQLLETIQHESNRINKGQE